MNFIIDYNRFYRLVVAALVVMLLSNLKNLKSKPVTNGLICISVQIICVTECFDHTLARGGVV